MWSPLEVVVPHCSEPTGEHVDGPGLDGFKRARSREISRDTARHGQQRSAVAIYQPYGAMGGVRERLGSAYYSYTRSSLQRQKAPPCNP